MFESIDQIKRANRESGYKFFSEGAMEFFHSRIETDVIGGEYFITSEIFGIDQKRRDYTIRRALEDGEIETVGGSTDGFGAYSTLSEAREALQSILSEREG